MNDIFYKRLKLPCGFDIPNNSNEIKKNERLFQTIKETLKFLRKYIFFLFFGNAGNKKIIIPGNVKNILWIGNHSNSIGDSLMELAPRSLLGEYNVDLLAGNRNASVFKNDIFFRHVYTDINMLTIKYDFIILDYFSTRSLRLKRKYFNSVPFFCIYEFFYGPDFNRLMFGYCRISGLLGLLYSDVNLRYFIHEEKMAYSLDNNKINVGISVGGIDSIRTYDNFGCLVDLLNRQYNDLNFFLFGAENGLAMADKIEIVSGNITNYVGRLNIQQSAFLIGKMSVFITCDGGLLHVAQAYPIPIISMFAKFKPEYRIVNDNILKMALYDDYNVNNISSDQILEAFLSWRVKYEN